MTPAPAFDPAKHERDSQDLPHTDPAILGSTVLRYEVSPSWRTAIDTVKDTATKSITATGEVPAEHLPDVGTLSPQSEADIAAARAEALAVSERPTT